MLTQKFSWTDQNVDIMRTMLERGNSATLVAQRLGCTRNAVIGKAHRLSVIFSREHTDNNGQKFIVPKKRMKWTEGALQKAASLWAAGRPKSLIASTFEVSMASFGDVIKRHPEHFPKRGHQHRPQPSSAPLVNSPAFETSVYAIEGVEPIRFVDATDKHCKFPICSEDGPRGADMPLCGADRTSGSYCHHHWLISRGRGTESERTAHRALTRVAR